MSTEINTYLDRIGPGPYAVIGYWELPSKALLEQNPQAYYAQIAAAPVTAGGPGVCGLCGTGIVCHFVLRCGNGARYFLGSDCIQKVNPEAYREAKRMQREARREERREALAAARAKSARIFRVQAAARARAYLREHPAVRADFVTAREIADVRLMASRMVQGAAPLHETQVRYLRNRAEDIRLPAGQIPDALPKRVQVEGRVLATRCDEGGLYGAQFKMLVRAQIPGSAGYVKLWGTIPQAVFEALQAAGTPGYHALVGREIRFAAGIERSTRDAGFGFVKRPGKAELLPMADLA